MPTGEKPLPPTLESENPEDYKKTFRVSEGFLASSVPRQREERNAIVCDRC
jgi:hypothetical protein